MLNIEQALFYLQNMSSVTWDPAHVNSTLRLSNGNLTITSVSTLAGSVRTNKSFSTGKWYCEVVVDNTGSGLLYYTEFGVVTATTALSNSIGTSPTGWSIVWQPDVSPIMYKFHNSSTAVYDGTLSNGDIIGMAMDLTNSFLYVAKNNTWLNSSVPTSGSLGTGALFSLSASTAYFPAGSTVNKATSGQLTLNQSPTTRYTPPSGYSVLTY